MWILMPFIEEDVKWLPTTEHKKDVLRFVWALCSFLVQLGHVFGYYDCRSDVKY